MRLRQQIFRQIVQIERRRAGARQAKFVQDASLAQQVTDSLAYHVTFCAKL